ncbi:MAG: outer membrane beta-barrel protein [Bacteroidetes bacterium]|nr:outer membrane beta-barrel protein [Bacteroidota bacterium]
MGQIQTVKIYGQVFDSLGKAPLQSANIRLESRKDSNNRKITFSNSKGFFVIDQVKSPDSFLLIVSNIGFEEFRQTIYINEKKEIELGKIYLRPEIHELGSITIKAHPAEVQFKKDTVEFNASNYQLKPNAILEELLKKLPGMEVDFNGSITFQGKKIVKILIDGKEFFANDLLIASRNLPAGIVSKIQVTDSKTLEQSFNQVNANGEEKIINIKLANTEKHFFGNAQVGVGTEKRYETGGMLNFIKGAKQLSVIGSSNNINKIGFTPGEVGLVSAGNGITDSKLGGINYSDQWNSKMNINGSYFLDNANTENESTIDRKQIITSDSLFFSDSKTKEQIHNSGQKFNVGIQYEPDTLTLFKITPDFGYHQLVTKTNLVGFTADPAGHHLNETTGNYFSNGTTKDLTLSAFIGRKFRKPGSSISISYGWTKSNQEGTSLNIANNVFFKSNNGDSVALVNQKSETTNDKSSQSLSLMYVQPLNADTRFIFSQYAGFTKSTFDKLTKQGDSTGHYQNTDSLYSGNFALNVIESMTNISLAYSKKSIDFSIGFNGFYYYMKNEFQSQLNPVRLKNFYVVPISNVTYRLKRNRIIQLNYSAATQQPTPEQLQPIPDNSNTLNIKTGNSGLKQAINQFLSLQYNSTGVKNNFFALIQFNPTKNKISSSISYDTLGRQISQYVNTAPTFSFASNVFYSHTVRNDANIIKPMTGIGFKIVKDISVVNGLDIVTLARNLNMQVGSDFVKGNTFNSSLKYQLVFNQITYNNAVMSSAKYMTHTVNHDLNINLPLAFAVQSNLIFTLNTNTPPGFRKSSILWNAGISKSLMNDVMLIKLSGYDILKNNLNFQRVVSNNYIEDRQTSILNQYIMLDLIFFLRPNAIKK